MTIGALEEPDLEIVMVPKKVSPRFNNTKSPGCRLVKKEFNLFNDFHGVEEFWAWVEVLESSPDIAEK